MSNIVNDPKSFRPGSLVRVRERDWIVLPSSNPDLLRLRPLGGTLEDETGIYLPLGLDTPHSSEFNQDRPIRMQDLGDLESVRMLRDASRLAFRNAAGPFRCLGKLSFRPRSYQMVPLIMALRQIEPVRLLIADDVGVGKTVEALLILKELLERNEIKRFAIVCPPHLCEQWQGELKDKFGIDAVVIRSNTQARLDREIQGDQSVFEYYRYQVISIDYIKQENRHSTFIQEAPEFVIVDEAHTCTVSDAANNHNQQMRYHLLQGLSKKENQHLVLLTATPHSGKRGEFQSLLGLVKPNFASEDLASATEKHRAEVAKHFVQRRRADVEKWMGENTVFPKRDTKEIPYQLNSEYAQVFKELRVFLKKLLDKEQEGNTKRIHIWSSLGLLRGVMSSPSHGVRMLQNRMERKTQKDLAQISSAGVYDGDFEVERDTGPDEVLDQVDWTRDEVSTLKRFAESLAKLEGINQDSKMAAAVDVLKDWLKSDAQTVIFCRYLATAQYVGKVLQDIFGKRKGLRIEVVTSEDPDEVRKQRIDDMKDANQRILVATDCLSEGINLQGLFNSVLHYDLPWNPNRLEQREGRVDRYGQLAPIVRTWMLLGSDNPLDQAVFEVLITKVREIRASIGIAIPFAENNRSFMEALEEAIDRDSIQKTEGVQTSLLHDLMPRAKVEQVTMEFLDAAEREKASRSRFAQHAIKAQEIEQDLQLCDQAIGDPAIVESFVRKALPRYLGAQITADANGYQLYTQNMPAVLKSSLPRTKNPGDPIAVCFHSPAPEGYLYLGRNHVFVEQLCQYLMANTLDGDLDHGPARAAVIRCREVQERHILCLFRVRNVIQSVARGHQMVAEEMLLWGFKGAHPHTHNELTQAELETLLDQVRPTDNMPAETRWYGHLEPALSIIEQLHERRDTVALERAQALIEAHERFRKAMGKGGNYIPVEPILPMDLMGVYVLLPAGGAQ
jgi:superfamily II DNA or RNA helicase